MKKNNAISPIGTGFVCSKTNKKTRVINPGLCLAIYLKFIEGKKIGL